MKIILELDYEGKLKEDDMIVYRDNKWKVIPKDFILSELMANDKQLQVQIDLLNQKLKETKEQVNKKLEEYHDVLQVLTKGE